MSITKNNTGFSVNANILGYRISYQASTVKDAIDHMAAVSALMRSRLAWA